MEPFPLKVGEARMPIKDTLKNEYQQIKPNFKYDVYKWIVFSLGALVLAVVAILIRKVSQYISWVPSWAPWAAVFGVALFIFNRLTKPSKSISPTQNPNQSVTPSTNATNFQSVEEFYRNYDNALIKETEAIVRKEVAKFKPGDDREGVLIRTLASGALMYDFDIAWYVSYGSQLKLLEALNCGNLTINEAMVYYDEAAQKWPGLYANRPFSEWLSFISNQYFVVQNGDVLAISVKGREFLKYLVHHGRAASLRAF